MFAESANMSEKTLQRHETEISNISQLNEG